MCGIVGAVAQRDIVPVLIEGLKRLEYRGYDSAGMAVLEPATSIALAAVRRLRSTGRVDRLAKLVVDRGLAGSMGIAHTRWATHGVPSTRNAHPHVSSGVSVVHNGIIENYELVRASLEAAGYRFESDTDTEVIAHLVHSHVARGLGLLEAVRNAIAELRGAYAIAVIDEKQPACMVVARMGAPLLLGLGQDETFAASDTAALLHVTRRVVYLEEGDCAEVGPGWVRIYDARGGIVDRPIHTSTLSDEAVSLGRFSHYMQKEIFEQPAALRDTLGLASASGAISARLFGPDAERILSETKRVQIIACGTSYHAGLVARYWIEGLAGVPCSVEIASEYRYRDPVTTPDTLVVAISQSGETADTLAALHHARGLGQAHSLAICNVPESALVRASTLRFLTRAGPEIGVASTKAFTCQLAALAALSVYAGRARGILSAKDEENLVRGLSEVPRLMSLALHLEPQIEALARDIAKVHHVLYLGRGTNYPIALEGALKLKEISYIHAEGYAAGELKHGPIALIDEHMPVVVIAPYDRIFDKTVSNMQEVAARGGRIILVTDRKGREAAAIDAVETLILPEMPAAITPLVYAVPVQLLAYHTAVFMGTDVDQPRNLAKSVTVE